MLNLSLWSAVAAELHSNICSKEEGNTCLQQLYKLGAKLAMGV